MSKKDQLENLATFIGLRAAHELMIKATNKPESIPHLEQEADNYSDLCFDLAKGNWDNEYIKKIRELAVKKCNKKLERYNDIDKEEYNQIGNIVDNALRDLELI